MDFALLPPEVNSGRMYAGPGAGPMLAAAAGWHALGAELESAASGYSMVVTGLAGQVWSGPTSLLMAAAAAPYVQWTATTGTLAQHSAAQAYGAAAAYEAAFAATVPPPVVAANRAQLAALVATNFFGQNTPAIAATEAQYAAMWAQDATAMYGYAAASQAASTLTPFAQPPRTTNPAGQHSQASAVAQATANTTQQASTTQHVGTTSQLADPILQPGNTITLDNGAQATLNAGVSVQTSSNFASGLATTTGATVEVVAADGTPVVYNLPAGGYFYAGGAASVTVETGAIYVLNQTGAAESFTVAGSAVDVTGIASAFSWNGSVLTATGAVNVAAAVTPTPVAPSASGLGAVSALGSVGSSPGLAGTAGIEPQFNAEGLAAWAQSLAGVSGAELDAGLVGAPVLG